MPRQRLLHQDLELLALSDFFLPMHPLVWWEGGLNQGASQLHPQRHQLELQEVSSFDEAQAVQRFQRPQLELQDIALQLQSLLALRRLPLASPALV